MSVYYTGCELTIVDPECNDCPVKELARVRGIAVIDKDFVFTDISDPSEWQTGIGNKQIWVFPRTRGTMEPTPTESNGFGNLATELDGYDFVLEIEEPNYTENCNWWNSIKRSKRHKVAYITESRIHLSEKAAQFIPSAPVADDVKAGMVWKATIKFAQEDNPCPEITPVGVFEECIEAS